MRIKSFRICAALAFAASLGAATAHADGEGTIQYIGPSTASFDGDDGYIAGFDRCAATDFGFEVENVTWCTTRAIAELGPSTNAPVPATAGEWVNPWVVGASADFPSRGGIDVSGIRATAFETLNCDNWSSVATPTTGIVWFGPSGSLKKLTCNNSRKLACCGEEDEED